MSAGAEAPVGNSPIAATIEANSDLATSLGFSLLQEATALLREARTVTPCKPLGNTGGPPLLPAAAPGVVDPVMVGPGPINDQVGSSGANFFGQDASSSALPSHTGQVITSDVAPAKEKFPPRPNIEGHPHRASKSAFKPQVSSALGSTDPTSNVRLLDIHKKQPISHQNAHEFSSGPVAGRPALSMHCASSGPGLSDAERKAGVDEQNKQMLEVVRKRSLVDHEAPFQLECRATRPVTQVVQYGYQDRAENRNAVLTGIRIGLQYMRAQGAVISTSMSMPLISS